MSKKIIKMVNPNTFENFIDLFIKTAIAVGVSVAGYHMRSTSEEIKNQASLLAIKSAEIAQLQKSVESTEKWLARIDSKLDRVIENKRQ